MVTSEAAPVSFPAGKLPDIRTRVIEDLTRPGPANPALRVYEMHLRAGMQMPADPAEPDPERQARLLVRNELSRLRNAALYWVSPEMTRLVVAAAPGMPAFYPGPQDLPSRYGLIYFASPIGDYEPWDVIAYAGGQLSDVPVAPSGTYQVCAATWGPWDNGGRWKQGGTWFTFYTVPGPRVPAALAARGLTRDEISQIEGYLPPLRIDNEAACPVSAADYSPAERPLEEAVLDPDSTSQWMHQVLCAFRLMETARMARVTEEQVVRPVRKRAGRARVAKPDSPVRLVDITAGVVRHERVPGGKGERRYHVRWTVDGHWRNQWYPKKEVHRPRWIDGYVKGPADAPLRVKQKVHVFRNGRNRL
jgi:hypothetical protein